MYAGRIVERGTVDDVFANPAHPYTEGLMTSIPQVEAKGGRLLPITGQPPNLAAIPRGCPFHPRCSRRRTGAEARPGRDCAADRRRCASSSRAARRPATTARRSSVSEPSPAPTSADADGGAETRCRPSPTASRCSRSGA